MSITSNRGNYHSGTSYVCHTLDGQQILATLILQQFFQLDFRSFHSKSTSVLADGLVCFDQALPRKKMQPVVKNKISFLYYLIYPSVDTEINFTFDGKASNPIRFLGYFDNKTWMLNFDCFGLCFFARKSSFRPSGSSDSLSYQCFSYDIKARNCVIPFQII